MPSCPRCHREVLTEIESCCTACDEEDVRLAQQAYEDFLNYDGDDYLSQPSEDGQSIEEAHQEVQDPRFIRLCLELGGLEYILKDRWATKGLLDAILRSDEGVLAALQAYASKLVAEGAVRAKPGPKPDPSSGKYKRDLIVELRAEGRTHGDIALKVYGDPKLANRVAATLSNNRKRTPQQ
jgi:hypothetical protein